MSLVSCGIPKKHYFCSQKGVFQCMKPTNLPLTVTTHNEQLTKDIEQSGMLIVREMHSFFNLDEDFVFPHVILTLCMSGSARGMYDLA